MIKIEREIRGYNFSGKDDGGIIFEVLPKKDENQYRLWQKYSVQTGIKRKKAIVLPHVELRTTGMLHINEGFLSDGVTGGPDTPKAMRSSFIHDALFGLIMRKYLPVELIPIVNDLFKKTCLEDKMVKWLVGFYRFMLKMFGKLHIANLIKKEDNKADSKIYAGAEKTEVTNG